MSNRVGRPLDAYLERGVSAKEVIELLKQHDCLTFPQLRSGLFPAANFDVLAEDETGMSNAWLRDSSCVGLVMVYAGEKDAAAKTVRAILAALQKVEQTIEGVISLGHAPEQDSARPPVRFSGQDSDPRYDWANAQNDALGYSLQLIGKAVQSHLIKLSLEDKAVINLVITYLDAIHYWEDADSGHWEEIKKVNASSIGTIVSGLKAVQSIASDSTKIVAMIQKGQDALAAILPGESKTPGQERREDAALLFLVEPQQIVDDVMAESIVASSEKALIGEYGLRRYIGDSYWGPDYREHFQLGNRTADFSKPEEMALRDSFLKPGQEAQWTLFDPLLATYYARRYQKTNDEKDAQQAKTFIVRSLQHVVTHSKGNREVWRIPELFFLENDEWVPNDHLGLLWAQANLWYGLLVYQEVFGGVPITFSDRIRA